MTLERKNIVTCIILFIVTCGFYGIYWLYCIISDINTISGDPDSMSPIVVILLSFVTCGIYLLFWVYKAGALLDQKAVESGRASESRAMIYLILTILTIPVAYFYIYSLIVYVIALIVVYIFAKNNRDKKMEELEERNRTVEKELNILRKDIIQDERVIQKEKKEFEERFANLKTEMYYKYKNYVNKEYLDRILNQDIEGVFKEAAEIEKEYETTMYKLSQINAERNVVESTSGKLTEIVEELEELKQEREKLLNYNDTIEIAKEVLRESYDELKNNVGPEFDKRLSYIVEKITNGKYDDVYIDNEHNIKMKTEHGEYVNLERFSTGTIEQVNLALRLAYIDTISKEKLPIILDEAFAFCDDQRLFNIMKFLDREYKERQVIIFTCSNREKKIIDEENIQANVVLI